MRKLFVALLSVAALGAVASPALAAAPTGTWKTTITGKAPALNGNWQIRLSASRADVFRNNRRVLSTNVSFRGNRMTINTRSSTGGANRCTSGAQRTGTYTYRLSGNRLAFTAVSDRCAGRRASLTTKAFTRG